MAFKPRIFISSTFSDNQKVRKRIEKHFIDSGAEPLLYESNLTPSTKPMTYRKDILEADFVILIMKEEYGTKTNWGMSGTHEEYRIAKENQIPIHVYLMPTETKDNKLLKELKSDQVSYYYFNSDNELLNRLKETSFIIAEEIVLRQLAEKKLPHHTVRQISCNDDYQRALIWIRRIEVMRKYHYNFGFDYLTTTIFTDFMEPISDYVSRQEHIFINWKLDEALYEMLEIAKEFIENHVYDYTAIPNTFRTLDDGNSSEVIITNVSGSNNRLSSVRYDELLERFFEKYEDFKNIVKDIRLFSDSN